MFKGLLSCFFSFPSVYLLLHIVKQLGNEGALLLELLCPLLSVSSSVHTRTDIP